MLGKLLKYDLKWSFKPLMVFYILAIFFSILGRIFMEIENSLIFNVLGQICLGVGISMIFNILINNLIRVWARFIRNIYKDESYLTHTLPIEKKTIYLSKILSAIISMLISTVVILISLIICYYSKENFEWLKNSIEFMANAYDSTVISFMATVIITLFLEILFAIFAGYIGIIMAHKSNNRRMVKAVIYGFIAYMIPQVFTLLAIFIIGLFNPEVMNLFNTTEILSVNAIKTVLNGGIIMYTIYIVTYYFIGQKQFEKGVNVE